MDVEGVAVLFFMLAAVVLAALVGALAFVTGPVGLAMAGVIAMWLALYAARGLLRKRANRAGDAAAVAAAVRRG